MIERWVTTVSRYNQGYSRHPARSAKQVQQDKRRYSEEESSERDGGVLAKGQRVQLLRTEPPHLVEQSELRGRRLRFQRADLSSALPFPRQSRNAGGGQRAELAQLQQPVDQRRFENVHVCSKR